MHTNRYCTCLCFTVIVAVVSDHVVDWYNTTSGQQISSMQPKCQSNVLSLTAVEFVNDVAALVHVA